MQIYVALLNEGTDVWRAVEAIHHEDHIFTTVGENESNGDEEWQFVTGDKVRCDQKIFSDGTSALVAVSRVP